MNSSRKGVNNRTLPGREAEAKQPVFTAVEAFLAALLIYGFWRIVGVSLEQTPEIVGGLMVWLGCVVAISFRWGRLWRAMGRTHASVIAIIGGVILAVGAAEVLIWLITEAGPSQRISTSEAGRP